MTLNLTVVNVMKLLKKNDDGIECETCLKWFHLDCTNLTHTMYAILSVNDGVDYGISWDCMSCKNSKRDVIKTLSSKIDTLIETIDSLKSELRDESQKRVKMEDTFDQKVRDIINEEKEKDRRKENVILHGIIETGGNSEESLGNDKTTINQLLEDVDTSCSLENCTNGFIRLGQKVEGKIRPIKIIFKEGSGMKKKLFKAREDGKLGSQFQRLKVCPDRTQREREQYSLLVKELIRRKDLGEKNLMIRNMQIVQRPTSAAPGNSSSAGGPAANKQSH